MAVNATVPQVLSPAKPVWSATKLAHWLAKGTPQKAAVGEQCTTTTLPQGSRLVARASR